MASSTKMQVINLYRRIMRLSRSWNASNPNNTQEERNYIRNEARYWFHKNSSISNPQSISDHIKEGEARVEMALHYRNPFPRPVNLPPKTYTVKQGKKSGSAQEKMKELSRPVYVKSIDHESGLKSGSSD